MVRSTVIETRRGSAHGGPVVHDRPELGHGKDVRLVKTPAGPIRRIQGAPS